MQRVSAGETVLARKRTLAIVVAVVVIFLAGGLYERIQAVSSLRVAGESFKTETVTSAAAQQQGLSGRDTLADDAVMVFPYEDVQRRCFWMKDMRISIDMVWLDAAKNVTAVERNVLPDTYPTSFCHDGQYVLEFSAGTAERLGLDTGDSAVF